MDTKGIEDLFQQTSILLNQLVHQLAEKDQTRTLVSVGTAVLAAKQGGSQAALLQEIFSKNFPGQPLPIALDSETFAALQKAQSEQKP